MVSMKLEVIFNGGSTKTYTLENDHHFVLNGCTISILDGLIEAHDFVKLCLKNFKGIVIARMASPHVISV